MLQQEKQYAALAPIMALAGIFAHPFATTLLPLALFFFYNWRKMEFAARVALRATDLAFSVQIFLFLASALLLAYMSIDPLPVRQAEDMTSHITLIAVGYLIISFVIAAIQAVRGKAFTNILSLKIAERILFATSRP